MFLCGFIIFNGSKIHKSTILNYSLIVGHVDYLQFFDILKNIVVDIFLHVTFYITVDP